MGAPPPPPPFPAPNLGIPPAVKFFFFFFGKIRFKKTKFAQNGWAPPQSKKRRANLGRRNPVPQCFFFCLT